jgi:hypothetical protein
MSLSIRSGIAGFAPPLAVPALRAHPFAFIAMQPFEDKHGDAADVFVDNDGGGRARWGTG